MLDHAPTPLIFDTCLQECKNLFDCATHVGLESVHDPGRRLHPWEWVVTNILSRRV